MDKKLLINTISKILKEYGFKKVPNTKYQWSKKEVGFSKIIYVYKSYYSNTYLMKYAFNFNESIQEMNEFDLGAPLHQGSTGIDIDEIFDLDTEYTDETRVLKIDEILSRVIDTRLNHISNVQELYYEIKHNQDSFMITYSALDRFNEHGFDTSNFE